MEWAEWKDKSRCPICNRKLIKKHEGMTCPNWSCILYSKLGRGWYYRDRKKEGSMEFFHFKYDFDIERHENIKEWLMLKSKILYERKKCEICGSDIKLQVHHILPRSQNPELALDKDNLILLCLECHRKIHEQDKYRFIN